MFQGIPSGVGLAGHIFVGLYLSFEHGADNPADLGAYVLRHISVQSMEVKAAVCASEAGKPDHSNETGPVLMFVSPVKAASH
ncbi:MAG: hypothetical protein JO022_19620 [Acidobacteriaceae bacterium]|nr:hypothetical protein [Acidobacteriaceae bacterium]